AERLLALRREHGPEAIGAFIGNPSGHDAGAMLYTTWFLRSLGTPRAFSGAHMDHFPKLLSSKALYGRASILPIPDLDRCDYFLCLGGNPAVSQGSLMSAPDVKRRLRAIQARGGKLVVVDPRRSETAKLADRHHFIRPGTDAYLLFAMVHVVFAEGRVALGHLADVVDGVEAVRELARPFPPEAVAEVTGIAAAEIRRMALEYADAARACCYGRIGTCTVEFGTLASWLIDVLGILTGHFDREGGMMFPRPPLGDLEPGPETGPFRIGRWRSAVRGLPEIDGQISCAAFAEEIDAAGERRMRGLLTVAANPVLTIPNGPRVDRALATLEFMVSVDIYLNETTRHAHVILPTLAQAEKENFDFFSATAIRNYVRWSPPAVDADPEGMSHGRVLLELAARLSDRSADALEREILESQARRLLARPGSPAHGVPLERALAALEGESGAMQLVDLMLRAGPYGDGFDDGAPGLSLRRVRAVPHAIDLGPLEPRLAAILRSPGRRIDLAHPHIAQDVARLEARLGERARDDRLLLIGRRQLRNMNSHLHNLPVLARGSERCTLLIHADDARRLGIAAGALARVRSRVGEVVVPALVDPDMMPGVVSLPHGYGHGAPGTRLPVAERLQPGVNSNALTDDLPVDPISGTCLANGIPVEVSAA
ncbi:MAG TPA: molybdopterin dinucleotide binding domain-containing protein, partial [Myxococcota bacterium]|nr:molybdopterin dinucleotide binding domain-containing protein [Myxococcota bacterium]